MHFRLRAYVAGLGGIFNGYMVMLGFKEVDLQYMWILKIV
jgi:hypothetical protein